MKKNLKSIIMILIIVIMGVSIYFTMNYAKNNLKGMEDFSKGEGQMPPNSSQFNNDNTQNMGEPPTKPDEESSTVSQSETEKTSTDNKTEPPAKPDGENSTDSQSAEEKTSTDNKTEPPAKPEGKSSTGSQSATEKTSTDNKTEPPTKPDGENSNSSMPQPPTDGNMPSMNNTQSKLTIWYYIIFTIENIILSSTLVYLIMSKLNKATIKETLYSAKKIIIYIAIVSVLTLGFTVLDVYITNNVFLKSNTTGTNMNNMPNNMNDGSVSVAATGNLEIDSEEKSLSGSYETTASDESAILVENGGNLTLTDATVTKSGGDSSNTENSEFYGVNSGILVTKNSTATIKNANITTNAKGSNAVFATGTDSKIYISDSTITTTGSSSSRGLDATYGGYIEADNVTITTQGGSCATLATDRGEGTVIAKNSKLETNGVGSPVIYSTGDISISNTEGVANGAQMVVVEGKNTATVEDSTLKCSGKGNKNDVDNCGIMIYQSMSGDAGEGTGTFNASNSILEIDSNSDYYKTAPFFFVTNTQAVINLENNTIKYGSNILLKIAGTSQWGKSGSNGGNVSLNATNQELVGNIEIDDISTLEINLKQGSSLTGTINGENTAKSVSLVMDESSTLTLTGDTYLSSLQDDDSTYSNINFNGYKLYVNGTQIN